MKSSRQPTLREQSKLDKRRRIEEAARETFAEQGFDKATTREIARRAGVGIATLFVYATDKAQLLRWMFASELNRMSADSASIAVNDTLASQLIQFFRPRYEIWLKDPRLSRTAMRIAFAEYLDYANRGEDRPTPMIWTNLRKGVRDLLARNEERRRLRADADVDLVAEAVFSIYLTQVHQWISQQNPSLEEGLVILKCLLDLICDPLEAK